MEFNVKTDIDIAFLKKRAFTEADQIFSKPSTRRNRSLVEIRESVLFGQAAEVYLMQHHGFRDDIRPYFDVIDPLNKPCEIKVTDRVSYVPYVLKRCQEACLEPWREKVYPMILYIFIGDKLTGDYYLYGTYRRNGNNFVKVKTEDEKIYA